MMYTRSTKEVHCRLRQEREKEDYDGATVEDQFNGQRNGRKNKEREESRACFSLEGYRNSFHSQMGWALSLMLFTNHADSKYANASLKLVLVAIDSISILKSEHLLLHFSLIDPHSLAAFSREE